MITAIRTFPAFFLCSLIISSNVLAAKCNTPLECYEYAIKKLKLATDNITSYQAGTTEKIESVKSIISELQSDFEISRKELLKNQKELSDMHSRNIEDLKKAIKNIERMPGPQGLRGPVGPRGPQGARGASGPAGPRGSAGRNSPLYGQKFCVLQAGGRCPTGFSNGSICIDSEDKDNSDRVSGVIGNSGANACGGSSKQLLLCCIQ